MNSLITILRQFSISLVFLIFIIGISPMTIHSQEEEEGIFWGEEEEYTGEEEYYEEEDTTAYEEEFYEEEGYEEEAGYEGEEEYIEEEGEYSYGEEEGEDELTDLEFVEEAERRGFTIQVSAASPGYVNHTLQTWNSLVDFRLGVDFPFLMQVGPIKFRFGAEIVTFAFKNYKPAGGEFKGVGFLGILSFPAGPSTVQFGAGMFGSSPAIIASQSFGLSVANVIDLRVGIRATNVFNLPDVFSKEETNASWLDGFVAVGYTL